MKTLCIIPARLASTRLPRKMLRLVHGMPMIQKTYLGAKGCPDIDKVVVATDSDEIKEVVEAVGAEVIMTDPELKTGSDRVAAVAKTMPEYDVIINLQGDEPFIKPEMLTELITPYKQGENPVMATLAFDMDFENDYNNPNFVKVILDQQGYALYFSRSPIPFIRAEGENIPVLHHMGLYAYQRDFLLKYTELKQTPLEKTELLEQLRAMEHGYKIRVSKSEYRTLEINTPEELELANALII